MSGPSATTDLQIDNAEARAVLAAMATRTRALLGSLPVSHVPVRRSKWTVGEVGAHLVVGLRGFTEAVDDRFDMVGGHIPVAELFNERLGAVTGATLAEVPERDPAILGRLVVEHTDAFLAATASCDGTETVPTPWYGVGASLPMATATAMLVGEQLVHGYDIATTVGRPWPISATEAQLVIRGVSAMMPLAFNPKTVAGLEATYDIRVRGGGPSFVVRVHAGAVTVEAHSGARADCHLSADAKTFVLVGYGRISQWGPIARGTLRAWGTRPWLGFRFTDLFFNP